MDCPDDETILRFIQRDLAADARTSVSAHVDRCDACRALVAKVSRSLFPAEDDVDDEIVADLAPGETVGRYQVVATIGRGGMGVVYLAHDPRLNRQVALKVLRADRDADRANAQARLLREAEALAQLSHPNVVAVYDAGLWHDQVFIAMELVAGGTLRTWAREHQGSARDILDAFVQAGYGLAAAHDAGLVHRDFKPENALIDRAGRVRVTDFGLARFDGAAPQDADRRRTAGSASPMLATPLTEAGSVLGTPAYMAPEQVSGRDIDARTDQFCFCVSLFEAI